MRQLSKNKLVAKRKGFRKELRNSNVELMSATQSMLSKIQTSHCIHPGLTSTKRYGANSSLFQISFTKTLEGYLFLLHQQQSHAHSARNTGPFNVHSVHFIDQTF